MVNVGGEGERVGVGKEGKGRGKGKGKGDQGERLTGMGWLGGAGVFSGVAGVFVPRFSPS